jgi:hypothetical protein
METPLVLIIIIITIFSIVVSGLFLKQKIAPKNNKFAVSTPAEPIHIQYMRMMFEQLSYDKIMHDTEDMVHNTLKQLFNTIKIVNKNIIDIDEESFNMTTINNNISYMVHTTKLAYLTLNTYISSVYEQYMYTPLNFTDKVYRAARVLISAADFAMFAANYKSKDRIVINDNGDYSDDDITLLSEIEEETNRLITEAKEILATATATTTTSVPNPIDLNKPAIEVANETLIFASDLINLANKTKPQININIETYNEPNTPIKTAINAGIDIFNKDIDLDTLNENAKIKNLLATKYAIDAFYNIQILLDSFYNNNEFLYSSSKSLNELGDFLLGGSNQSERIQVDPSDFLLGGSNQSEWPFYPSDPSAIVNAIDMRQPAIPPFRISSARFSNSSSAGLTSVSDSKAESTDKYVRFSNTVGDESSSDTPKIIWKTRPQFTKRQKQTTSSVEKK